MDRASVGRSRRGIRLRFVILAPQNAPVARDSYRAVCHSSTQSPSWPNVDSPHAFVVYLDTAREQFYDKKWKCELSEERFFLMLHTLSTLHDVQKMYDWFEEMRNAQPVWLDESSGCWHVFRYADVRNIISDYTLFSSEGARRRFQALAAANTEAGRPRAGRSIIAMDPPQHRQYPSLVSHAFTPRAIEPLRGRLATHTQELLAVPRT